MKIIMLGPSSTGRSEISSILAGKMQIPYHSYNETGIQDEYYVMDIPEEIFISKENSEAVRIIKKEADRDSIIVGLLPSRENEGVENYERFSQLFKNVCDFVTYTKDKSAESIGSEILRDVKIVLNFKGN